MWNTYTRTSCCVKRWVRLLLARMRPNVVLVAKPRTLRSAQMHTDRKEPEIRWMHHAGDIYFNERVLGDRERLCRRSFLERRRDRGSIKLRDARCTSLSRSGFPIRKVENDILYSLFSVESSSMPGLCDEICIDSGCKGRKYKTRPMRNLVELLEFAHETMSNNIKMVTSSSEHTSRLFSQRNNRIEAMCQRPPTLLRSVSFGLRYKS